MEKTRPILYGVADYAQIRKKNGWFIDRTAKIRDLEATAYVVFLRPRRFGKSLLISMLHAYYDVNFADRFEEFFGGTEARSPLKHMLDRMIDEGLVRPLIVVTPTFNRPAEDGADPDTARVHAGDAAALTAVPQTPTRTPPGARSPARMLFVRQR